MIVGLLIIFFIILITFLLGYYNETKTFCTPESRLSEVCITLYKPVCGYFNQSIQCIKAPCADTYSNSCVACLDQKVSYWTEGECEV